MATSEPDEILQILLEEASDPATDPERLRELARDYAKYYWVAGAVLRNPSVPEETWRDALLGNCPEAWDNPMAPIYLIAWTPRQDDWQTLEEAAARATYKLLRDPTRCSTQGKVLIATKMVEWWDTTEDAKYMMWLLARWAEEKGLASPEHRKVVRILVECVRTTPDLTAKDNEALDLLKRWAEGGEDRRNEAEELDISDAVRGVAKFAQDLYEDTNSLMHLILLDVAFGKKGAERKEAMAKHARKLANLIRHDMPLPPGVE